MSTVSTVFLIGAGHRGKALLRLLLDRSSSFILVGIFDENLDAIESAKTDFPEAKRVSNSPDIVTDNLNEVDLWLVCSMNHLHLKHIDMIKETKTNIFCEKPLGISMTELKELKSIVDKSEFNFMTGFVLRHSPFYQKIRELCQGRLGKILSVEVHDNLYYGHGAYIMSNWRRHMELSGGHLVEKCVHVLDLINWILDDTPVDVKTFKRHNIWTPENKVFGEELKKSHNDTNLFNKYHDYHKNGSMDPFTSDKSISHSSVSIMKYAKDTLVTFNVNTFCPNSSRRFHIVATFGEIEARWTKESGKIELVTKGIGKKDTAGSPEERIIYDFGPTNCHGNADPIIIDYLTTSVEKNMKNEKDFEEAYMATMTGIMLEDV